MFPDPIRKVIVVRDNIRARRNEEGITTIGVCNFLLDEDSLNLEALTLMLAFAMLIVAIRNGKRKQPPRPSKMSGYFPNIFQG